MNFVHTYTITKIRFCWIFCSMKTCFHRNDIFEEKNLKCMWVVLIAILVVLIIVPLHNALKVVGHLSGHRWGSIIIFKPLCGTQNEWFHFHISTIRDHILLTIQLFIFFLWIISLGYVAFCLYYMPQKSRGWPTIWRIFIIHSIIRTKICAPSYLQLAKYYHT